MHTVSGIPIQDSAKKPGTKYAELVAAEWVPAQDVVLVCSRVSAFAFLSLSFSEAVTNDELSSVTYAYGEAAYAADPIAVVRIRFDSQGVATVGKPTRAAPIGAPDGWLEEVASVILKHDAKYARRLDNKARKRSATDESVTGMAVARLSRRYAPRTIGDGVTHRVFGNRNVEPRIVFKHKGSVIGRLSLADQVLVTNDENIRHDLFKIATEAGLEPLPPLSGWDAVPRVHLTVEKVSAWGGAYAVRIPNPQAPDVGLEIAIYFPATKKVMLASNGWKHDVIASLEWHGLVVDGTAEQSPVGYPTMNRSERYEGTTLALKEMARNARPIDGPARRRVSAPENNQAAYRRRFPTHGLRTLPDAKRAMLPEAVAAFTDRWISAELIDENQPDATSGRMRWRHRTPLLKNKQIRKLLAAVEPIPLPPNSDAACEWAARTFPRHRLLMAALWLRAEAPQWWAELPWADRTRARRGVLAEELGGRMSIQRGLADMSDADAMEARQAALVALVRGGELPDPELPTHMTQDDLGRLWVAAAALAHAGFGFADANHRQDSNCIVCGRRFYPGAHTIANLLYLGADDVCTICTDESRKGQQSIPVDEAALVAAIRALAEQAGGIPSLYAVRGSTNATSIDDRFVQVSLRLALPERVAWGVSLEKAGLLEGSWRPGRGVISVAADGHHCRSLFERYVDDWFFHAGIAHESEPPYPYDAELNPNGSRADWRVQDVYVEAAGLLQDAAYALRMERKRKLAARHGIELIVLEPDDVARLPEFFSRWL